MKILLFGCNGQVGWELQRSLAALGELVAVGHRSDANPAGLCGDLTDFDGVARTVQIVQPSVIVNAAAYTAVDRAESESEIAHSVNAVAPGVLAQEAQRLGAWMVHFSTDYVFDGSGDKPWSEDDTTGPQNVYGHTKLAGELAVARCQRHLIFRTSWVYAARGGNFAKTMLRLATERELMQVIDDQFGAPTGAELLADVTALALHRLLRIGSYSVALAGIYHLAAAGCTTWYDYAKFVVGHMDSAQPAIKKRVKELRPVPTSAFPTAAQRPKNSRLDTSKLQKHFNLRLPNWQVGVTRMLTEIDYAPSH